METPFSELERFQPLSGYERVSSESGARAKTGAGNEPSRYPNKFAAYFPCGVDLNLMLCV